MFGWAEQKSSLAFRTKCVQTYSCGLEIQGVSFSVKQFILRLFPWNVNCPFWMYFLVLARMQESVYHDSELSSLFFFLLFFAKTVHSTKPSSIANAIFCSVSHQPGRAMIQVQAKRFSMSSVSGFAVSYLLQRKFVLRSISTTCASEHIKKVTWCLWNVTIKAMMLPSPYHWEFM